MGHISTLESSVDIGSVRFPHLNFLNVVIKRGGNG